MDILPSFDSYHFDTNERVYMNFHSYRELLDYSLWDGPSYGDRSSHSGSFDFTRTDSFREAYELAVEGWVDGISHINEYVRKSELYDKAKKSNCIDLVNSHHGSYIDIGRHLSGDPEDMIRIVNQYQFKSVDIIVDCAASWVEDWDHFYNFGSKVISIIDFYESNNIRTRITSRQITSTDFTEYSISVIDVTVKDHGQFVDMNRLAFVLCHPSFLRRILFSVEERHPENIIKNFGYYEGGGYGIPVSALLTQEEIDEGCLLLNHENIDKYMDSEKLVEILK